MELPSEEFRLLIEKEIQEHLPRVLAAHPNMSEDLALVRARVQAVASAVNEIKKETDDCE